MGEKMAAQIAEAVPGVEAVAVPSTGELPDGVRGDVLLAEPFHGDLLPELLDRGVRWVHVFSTGVDTVPLDVFRGRDVLITCSRGASAVPIAEFVLAAMLAFEKRMPEVWVSEVPEIWSWHDLGGLRGRTVGLVGLGGIGSEVARLSLAFGMRVVALRRRADVPPPLSGVEMVASLDDLLPVADHLVVAAPATARTRHLLDAAAFERVKAGVHLVNVARGSLVDQGALIAALDDGRVAVASLDVCDPEPLPAGHPLYAHPSVRLSPHVSWVSHERLTRTLELFVAELHRYLAGEPPLHPVDLDEGY